MIAQRLQRGDVIGIVSPSGAVAKETIPQLNKGIAVLKNLGFKIKLGKNALKNTFRYSATAQEKAEVI